MAPFAFSEVAGEERDRRGEMERQGDMAERQKAKKWKKKKVKSYPVGQLHVLTTYPLYFY